MESLKESHLDLHGFEADQLAGYLKDLDRIAAADATP